MALKLGELVAYLKADDTALDRTLRAVRTKLEAAGQKARQYGPVVGAALAAGIGAGLVSGLELEGARAKLAAQVGDPAMAQQLGEVAGRVYGRGFGESAADAMLSARSVMQAGLLPKGADAAIIEDLTVKAQALASTFDLDVTQAARAAGQMLRTGLAKNAEEAFDLLTRGFQVSGDQAGDLLDSFSEYSTQFRKLGLSGAEAMGLMNQGVQAGARDLDVVSDALKEFAIRAADGSETSAAGFKALGLSAERMTAIFAKGGPQARDALGMVLERLQAMKDPTEREAAAVALFGTKAEDLQGALLGLDLDTAAQSLGDVGGAAARMGEQLEQSASQKVEAFKRKAQQALVEKLSEALPTIEKVVGWLDKHSGVIGPIITGLGALAVIIGVILGVYKAWIVLQTALNIVMMLNPIGLIVIAIIGLIAIIVGLWMRFEGFRNFWKSAWDLIWGAIKFVWDWISENWPLLLAIITGPIGLAVLYITRHWDEIKAGASAAWKWIVGKWNSLVDFVTGLPGRLARAARGMWDGIKNAFRSAINWIIGKWNDLSFHIPGISIPGLGQVWGGATLSTPNIPMLARGGHILGSGLAVVGERGPELVHLGRGATVQPLASGSAVAGLMRLLLTGEFRIRGGDLVLVLREQVATQGGDVQRVIGSNT